MTYYQRTDYVSNSMLSSLKRELLTPEQERDLSSAYKMGSLFDMILTEPDKINLFEGWAYGDDGEVMHYAPHEVEQAVSMAKVFRAKYADLIARSQGQQEFYADEIPWHYDGVDFTLAMRCKFDLFHPSLGTEIKTTACTKQDAFLQSIYDFDYDRAAYIYMTLAGLKRYQIIGISKKKPHALFHIPIVTGSPIYCSGAKKATELAYKYYMLKM